jgi:hypothetical protein
MLEAMFVSENHGGENFHDLSVLSNLISIIDPAVRIQGIVMDDDLREGFGWGKTRSFLLTNVTVHRIYHYYDNTDAGHVCILYCDNT